MKPHICPVLAFAKYALSHPGVLQNNGRNQLFPGGNQYHRFLKIFHHVLTKHSAEILALGVDPNDLGSHSTRKGSATLVASGCIVSPPHSSLCLRAGWSMGSVKDRYIHHESAGDQFVGRTATGLSCLSTDFACSPCYFDFTDTENEEELRQQLDDFIRSNIVGGRQMTAKVAFMARFFFSLIDIKHITIKHIRRGILAEAKHTRPSSRRGMLMPTNDDRRSISFQNLHERKSQFFSTIDLCHSEAKWRRNLVAGRRKLIQKKKENHRVAIVCALDTF